MKVEMYKSLLWWQDCLCLQRLIPWPLLIEKDVYSYGSCPFSLCSFPWKMWRKNQIFTMLSLRQPGVLQDWNPAAAAWRNPGWPKFVRLWVGTHNKPEPSLTFTKLILGEFAASAQQCWRQDIDAEMVQTFLWMPWIHWAEGGSIETISLL